jgi:hypothetical protein
MIYAILVLLGIAFVLGLLSFLTTVSPTAIRRVLTWGLGGAAVVLGLFFLLTGRVALDLPLALLFYYLRSGGRLRWPSWLRHAGGGTAAQEAAGTSAIETPWLRMTLDRSTGALDGDVLAGRFAGAPLGRLDLGQLQELHAECTAADEQSARLIETYLDRLHQGWRDRQPAPPSASGRMTREEALQVLGLTGNVTDDQIRDAHRRLMLKLHPDLGGSDYLAGKINLARDVLLHAEAAPRA